MNVGRWKRKEIDVGRWKEEEEEEVGAGSRMGRGGKRKGKA